MSEEQRAWKQRAWKQPSQARVQTFLERQDHLSNFKFRFDFLKLLILAGPDASAGVAEFDVDCLLLVDAADVRIFCVAFTR